MLEFNAPLFLLLLVFIPILIFIIRLKSVYTKVSLLLPTIFWVETKIKRSSWWVKYGFIFLLSVSYVLLVIALARPQIVSEYQYNTTMGINIILAVDVSLSMAYIDGIPERMKETFYPSGKYYYDPTNTIKNRLEIAKKVLNEFVKKRIGDRIGLVAFSGEAITICPLTLKHDILLEYINKLNLIDTVIQKGTKIADAIGISINRLKFANAKSNIIILVTDGNDHGDNEITVTEMAYYAKNKGIKIFSIGIGDNKLVLSPEDAFESQYGTLYNESSEEQLNEDSLKNISDITGGKFFRAFNIEDLTTVYDEINNLEKSEIKYKIHKTQIDIYEYFLIAGFILIVISYYFNLFLWKKNP